MKRVSKYDEHIKNALWQCKTVSLTRKRHITTVEPSHPQDAYFCLFHYLDARLYFEPSKKPRFLIIIVAQGEKLSYNLH
jgi:hypothetical protein